MKLLHSYIGSSNWFVALMDFISDNLLYINQFKNVYYSMTISLCKLTFNKARTEITFIQIYD